VTNALAGELSAICAGAGRLVLARGVSGRARKAGHEVVTDADLQSEILLRKELSQLTPGVPVIGEEGNDPVGEPPYWLVDPLDGTTNFAHGYPVFSISAALYGTAGLETGCVHDPVRGETFVASRGEGAFLNGARISSSATSEIGQALLATGFPYARRPADLGFDLSPLLYFLGRAQGIRRSGSAALDLSYVACGRLDGYWEQHLRPWDMAAGALMLTEAGGRLTGIDGQPFDVRKGQLMASNGPLHERLLEVVRRWRSTRS